MLFTQYSLLAYTYDIINVYTKNSIANILENYHNSSLDRTVTSIMYDKIPYWISFNATQFLTNLSYKYVRRYDADLK